MQLPLPDFKVDQGILELEAKVGVKENFFRGLLEEDDWSFVIKLHALFEASCTHLLLFHFAGAGALSDVLSPVGTQQQKLAARSRS